MYDDISGPDTQDRKWLEVVKTKYPRLTPTLGALRQEIILKNNSSNYAFNFSAKNALDSGTEQLLSIQDAFAANKLGLFLLVREKTRRGTGALLTYPNREALALAFANSTADAPSAAALRAIADLETVYNGTVGVQIDTTNIFDGLDTRRFRTVPTTQAGIFASQAASQHRDGVVGIEPYLHFDGTRKNTVTVNVPSFPNMAIEPDNVLYELVLVCVAYGFRVQGGANIKQQ